MFAFAFFLLLIGSGMESFIISDQNSKGSGSDHNQKIKCKDDFFHFYAGKNRQKKNREF